MKRRLSSRRPLHKQPQSARAPRAGPQPGETQPRGPRPWLATQHKGASLCGLKGPVSAALIPSLQGSRKQGLILQGQRGRSKDEGSRLRRLTWAVRLAGGQGRATVVGGPLGAAGHRGMAGGFCRRRHPSLRSSRDAWPRARSRAPPPQPGLWAPGQPCALKPHADTTSYLEWKAEDPWDISILGSQLEQAGPLLPVRQES